MFFARHGATRDPVSERDRVRWNCRRGMLELDIVLKRFVERELDRLTPGQLAALQALLELPDNDLWDLVSERYQPPDADADMQSVTSLLRSV